MKSSKVKSKPPSQLERMIQAAARAPLSLSQCLQPHALLPTGNSVPLASEAYYTYISLALLEQGLRPAPSQLGHLIRQLNSQAMLSQVYETINLRIAHPAPQTYTIDLATAYSEVIQLSADGWKVTTDFDTRFFRPDNCVPFQPPVKVKTKLHQALQDIFNIQESKSKQLSTWLVDALLQNQTQPTLIITGKFRHEAAAKLRAYVDPSVCPVHTMPASRKAMGRLAITNRLIAFEIHKQLSPSKIEMLNEMRTGTIVELKQVSRNSEAISTLVRRPIILSAEQAPKIHETQIEIEVDEIAVVERCELLSALLDAAVHQIRQLQEREERQVYLERAAPEMAGYTQIEEDSEQGPGP